MSDEKTPSPSDFVPYVLNQDEEYMNEKQREHFRSILLRWKEKLVNSVERTVQQMQYDAANFPDLNDRATQEEEFTIELRTR
ncbi:MAG: RNA polymerase-binding protein DksA, partial [Beggiatoa sp. IS2]